MKSTKFGGSSTRRQCRRDPLTVSSNHHPSPAEDERGDGEGVGDGGRDHRWTRRPSSRRPRRPRLPAGPTPSPCPTGGPVSAACGRPPSGPVAPRALVSRTGPGARGTGGGATPGRATRRRVRPSRCATTGHVSDAVAPRPSGRPRVGGPRPSGPRAEPGRPSAGPPVTGSLCSPASPSRPCAGRRAGDGRTGRPDARTLRTPSGRTRSYAARVTSPASTGRTYAVSLCADGV